MRISEALQWVAPIVALLQSSHASITSGTRTMASLDHNNVEIFPIPSEVLKSTAFRVEVHALGNSTRSAHVVELFQTPVHEINTTTGRTQVHQVSVGILDFDGSIKLSITPDVNTFPTINTVRVRPLSYHINATINERTVEITLEEPKDLMIEINGDIFNALHLFTGSLSGVPSPAANSTLIRRYDAGFHVLNETVKVLSGETIYLEPGAVVKGDFVFQNISNAAIIGRGVLYQAGSILIESSEDIRVEGVTVLNPLHYSLTLGMANNVFVSQFRSISGVKWGDGIDVFCSSNVVLEKLFMRNSDDCIALYQHRWGYIGDSHNITVRDSALWADVAHPIHIGLHGNSVDPETMEGVNISNIDILDHREAQIDYMGCIAINCGDENLITNVSIDNIRIEDFRMGMLFNIKVFFNAKYNTSPGRGIKNIRIKDVSYDGQGEIMSLLSGYNETRSADFIDFQGLVVNGKEIWDGMAKPGWYQTADSLPMFVGSFVNNLTWSQGKVSE
ncbi:unnamed protein product [Clonostachys rhizophaga]|uniref:Endo-polygalacturonase n=1 Tax=Clonostachys rhizophaga TaxID=160324 RepID=A0A9N9VI58_9HYPO|nr:unnamed protein product [Clonostachys rhizophaga]